MSKNNIPAEFHREQMNVYYDNLRTFYSTFFRQPLSGDGMQLAFFKDQTQEIVSDSAKAVRWVVHSDDDFEGAEVALKAFEMWNNVLTNPDVIPQTKEAVLTAMAETYREDKIIKATKGKSAALALQGACSQAVSADENVCLKAQELASEILKDKRYTLYVLHSFDPVAQAVVGSDGVPPYTPR